MEREKTKSRDSVLNKDLAETYLKEKARREKEYNVKQKFKQKSHRDDSDFTYKLRKTKRK